MLGWRATLLSLLRRLSSSSFAGVALFCLLSAVSSQEERERRKGCACACWSGNIGRMAGEGTTEREAGGCDKYTTQSTHKTTQDQIDYTMYTVDTVLLKILRNSRALQLLALVLQNNYEVLLLLVHGQCGTHGFLFLKLIFPCFT